MWKIYSRLSVRLKNTNKHACHCRRRGYDQLTPKYGRPLYTSCPTTFDIVLRLSDCFRRHNGLVVDLSVPKLHKVHFITFLPWVKEKGRDREQQYKIDGGNKIFFASLECLCYSTSYCSENALLRSWIYRDCELLFHHGTLLRWTQHAKSRDSVTWWGSCHAGDVAYISLFLATFFSQSFPTWPSLRHIILP